MSIAKERRLLEEINYSLKNWVVVVGAGAVLQEKFTPDVLDKLGTKKRRVVIDIDPARVRDKGVEERGLRLTADAVKGLPLSLRNLSETERKESIAVITTPDHLGPIRAMIEIGVEKFIVEKPLVNNKREVSQLLKLLQNYPEVRVYPLDFYVQKAAPLLLLTGVIEPDDPRFTWVAMADGKKVNHRLSEMFDGLIGDIEGIEVTVLEGGSLGIPDLNKRQWLETDNLRGGMLLDLGTHALAPLYAAGIIPQEGVKVENASRKVLGTDRKSYIKAVAGQPEIFSQALLTIEKKGRKISCLVTVGKTFHDGGMWKTIIRGSQGDISMGLRTGQRLTVEPKEGDSFQLKLKANDPYGMAFQEARMYFDRFPGFDGNLKAMLNSISIIDEIKSVADVL